MQTFRHKGLEPFFCTGSKAGIQPEHAKRLRLQLTALDSTVTPLGMDLPGWRLHRLTGQFHGHWAVTFSGNW
ncbi:MAG: type II toxin-antitoxin system RelE/ParE family toxin [Gammaproteobacteria bacterium]|nr:type II toxin-antitoxin system RelE/ParE family toxin [Gammaproteobacteria bacterium]